MAVVHVLPVDDLIEHEMSQQCLCGPAVEEVEGGIVVLHHSLDGREFSEPDYDGPPQRRELY